jgi:hypothetical protein
MSEYYRSQIMLQAHRAYMHNVDGSENNGASSRQCWCVSEMGTRHPAVGNRDRDIMGWL